MKKKDLEIITMMIEVIKESQKEITEVKARAQKIERCFESLRESAMVMFSSHGIMWLEPSTKQQQVQKEHCCCCRCSEWHKAKEKFNITDKI